MTPTKQFLKEYGLMLDCSHSKFMLIDAWLRFILGERLKERHATLTGSDFSHRSVRYIRDQLMDQDAYSDRIKSDIDTLKADEMDFDVLKVINGEETLSLTGSVWNGCADCAEQLVYNICGINIMVMAVNNKPCESYGHFTVDVEFPTGQVLTNDYIHTVEAIDYDYIDERTSSSLKNEAHRARAWAKHGVLHMSVGNSCPAIGICDDKLIFGDSDCFESQQSNDHEPEIYKRIGGVCTDNWTVMLIDSKVMENLCKDNSLDFDEEIRGCGVINIKPGIYRFMDFHMTEGYGDELQPNHVRLRAERIGDCK